MSFRIDPRRHMVGPYTSNTYAGNSEAGSGQALASYSKENFQKKSIKGSHEETSYVF